MMGVLVIEITCHGSNEGVISEIIHNLFVVRSYVYLSENQV